MKNAPLAEGERVSESRFDSRQEETTRPEASIKPHSQEERPERFLPYHSPHGLQTEAELVDFITEHKPEGEP